MVGLKFGWGDSFLGSNLGIKWDNFEPPALIYQESWLEDSIYPEYGFLMLLELQEKEANKTSTSETFAHLISANVLSINFLAKPTVNKNIPPSHEVRQEMGI